MRGWHAQGDASEAEDMGAARKTWSSACEVARKSAAIGGCFVAIVGLACLPPIALAVSPPSTVLAQTESDQEVGPGAGPPTPLGPLTSDFLRGTSMGVA